MRARKKRTLFRERIWGLTVGKFAITINRYSRNEFEAWFCWVEEDDNRPNYSPSYTSNTVRGVMGKLRLALAEQDPKIKKVHEKMRSARTAAQDYNERMEMEPW